VEAGGFCPEFSAGWARVDGRRKAEFPQDSFCVVQEGANCAVREKLVKKKTDSPNTIYAPIKLEAFIYFHC